MRRLAKPGFPHEEAFQACLQGIGDVNLVGRLASVQQQVLEQDATYSALAAEGRLFDFPSHERAGDDMALIGLVTRGEFKKLYTQQFARSGKPARDFYDRLRLSSPNNICPYCGFGLIETLDHFLPKSNYSSLSVLPINLVPSCSDCNRKKHDGIATQWTLLSHPYFEDPRIFQHQWLYAFIAREPKPYATFAVVTPQGWPQPLAQRLGTHFVTFELARRYSEQSSERLVVYAQLINEMNKSGAHASIGLLQQMTVEAERKAGGENSWQVALARAVVQDEWFRIEGFSHLV